MYLPCDGYDGLLRSRNCEVYFQLLAHPITNINHRTLIYHVPIFYFTVARLSIPLGVKRPWGTLCFASLVWPPIRYMSRYILRLSIGRYTRSVVYRKKTHLKTASLTINTLTHAVLFKLTNARITWMKNKDILSYYTKMISSRLRSLWSSIFCVNSEQEISAQDVDDNTISHYLADYRIS